MLSSILKLTIISSVLAFAYSIDISHMLFSSRLPRLAPGMVGPLAQGICRYRKILLDYFKVVNDYRASFALK